MLRQSTKTLTTVQKRLLSATPQFLPLRTEYEAPLHAIPGDAKRRILDVTKQQPTYESPYNGHPGFNPEPPGYTQNYEGYWDDKVQREWIYKDEAPYFSARQSLVWTLYLFGWGVSLWTLYRKFFQPVRPLHPATAYWMTEKETALAKQKIAERREDIKKYNL